MRKNKGFTLIELIMVIVIVSILVAVAAPNVTRNYMIANDTSAEANIQIIAAALENYATVNGSYPTAETQLTSPTPPYLNQSFCGNKINGYNFSCTLAADTYSVIATPSGCGKTGSKTHTITTGSVLTSADCS